MAVPVLTTTGSGSSKTTGTTLVVTLTTTSYTAGDCVAVGFGMDQAAGTVSVSTTGTATVGAWTTQQDTTVGSGTAGSRLVYAWAKVTGSGTVLTLTVTAPSVAARAAEVFKVTGADATTPVMSSAPHTTLGSGVTITSGRDVTLHNFSVAQLATGTAEALNQTPASPWAAGTVETVLSGTTGGSGSTNISVMNAQYTRSPTIAQSGVFLTFTSAMDSQAQVAWQFIPAATKAPNAVQVISFGAMNRAATR